MIFLFHELVHKKWFHIFTSENHDAWHLNFMCCITVSFIFCYVFVFLVQKDPFYMHISTFCFSSLQKDFDIFHERFFELFLCFSDPVIILFIHMKKIFDQSVISFKNYDLHEPHFYDSFKNHLKIA